MEPALVWASMLCQGATRQSLVVLTFSRLPTANHKMTSASFCPSPTKSFDNFEPVR